MTMTLSLESAPPRPGPQPHREPDNSIMGQLGVCMPVAKDEEVYGQGDEVGLIYRVISGAVRASRVLSDGRRQIGAFYYPGDVFGVGAGPTHLFSAEATRDGVILALQASALREAAGEQAYGSQLLAATKCELDRAHEQLLLLGRKTARERVASFLINLADRGRTECVVLPMGRQDMADYLGLTIETVSRMLTQLQSAMIVEFTESRRYRISNRPALAYVAH